jgi:hypothetical protein
MRKFMMLGALVAVVVAALAVPALAQQGDFFRGDPSEFGDYLEDQAEAQGREFDKDLYNNFLQDYYRSLAGFYGFGEEDYWGDDYQWDERNDHDWWNDWRHDDDRDNDRNNDEVVPAVSQDFDQRAESGDVNQSFNVSNRGDNSNQCAGIQGVANTGNAQNQVGVIQYGSEAEDIEFEDSGASITVSPNSFTSCDQQVNQAASASGW